MIILYVFLTSAVLALIYKGIVSAKQSSAQVLENDLSNDYQRWTPSQLAIAGYIGLFLEDDVRLDNYFQALIYAVLKRSDRAVDEKIRRISTAGAPNSDASVADKDIAFILATYTVDQAKQNFLNDLYTAGASLKQVKEITKYL